MNTRHEDTYQAEYVREYLRRKKDARWFLLWAAGICVAGALLMAIDAADAAGTVTETKYVQLTRSGTPLTTLTTPKLPNSDCPVVPATAAECNACMAKMIDTESKSRTTGYVTYRCHDDSQSYVKFTKAAPAPTCTTPKPAQQSQTQQCPAGTVGTWPQTMDHVAAAYPTCWSPGEWTPAEAPAGMCASQLKVYTCADAGADGRILESSTVSWPNCSITSYQLPSKGLVVAVNTGSQPFYWRLASKVTSGRIWTESNGWQLVGAINWGAMGTASVTWTPPTENMDGTPLTDLAGYRILYGTTPTDLTQAVEVKDASARGYVLQLPAATYSFAVQSIDSAGTVSPMSNIATAATK